MSWRDRSWVTRVYRSCTPINLNPGAIISNTENQVTFIDEAIYKVKCYEDAIPMMTTKRGRLFNVQAYNLPIVQDSWRSFSHNDISGSFNYSVVPIIYSIAALAVITWFLTIFVLTSYTIKPSLLLKSSTILSSVFLLIVVVRSIVDLHVQQKGGYLSGAILLNAINTPLYLSIIDLIVVFLLQINEVQVIMRLFLRQKDKRLTLVVGLTAILCSQIIWAISKFYHFNNGSEAGDILPTFIYLTRTAMAICYAALVSVFLILKINDILANKRIWLLTLFTFVMIYGPVAFFVADVANAFIYELSEIFSVVLYVVCVVIPWEWCNKFNLIMKVKEKEGVLGRRFYEDELYELDGLELFVEEEYSDSASEDDGDGDEEGTLATHNLANGQLLTRSINAVSHDDNDNKNNTGGVNAEDGNRTNRQAPKKKIKLTKKKRTPEGRKDINREKGSRYVSVNRPRHLNSGYGKFTDTIDRTKQAFVDITDKIIATGFAIPRSVSVPSTNSPENQRGGSFPMQTFKRGGDAFTSGDLDQGINQQNTTSANQEHQVDPDNSARNRRDVFVYSTKQVVLGFSDSEGEDADEHHTNNNNNNGDNSTNDNI